MTGRASRSTTVGSLFSGIGGLDLGLERAGMRVIWQVENDHYCNKVLAKHWPDVPRYGDIKTIDWSELERPDLICGGFPCQPVSYAGKRLAQQDERWLWPYFRDAIRALRPRFVLVENVPGLLTAGLGDVLGDLATLGYDAEWDCIPAAAVGGPHLRDRVYTLAHPAGVRLSRGDKHLWLLSADHLRDSRTRQWNGRRVAEPGIQRVAHGVPSRVDRLRGLGNAVVPQVAEWVGRRIMEAS